MVPQVQTGQKYDFYTFVNAGNQLTQEAEIHAVVDSLFEPTT